MTEPACACGADRAAWRAHRKWCPAYPKDPPLTTIGGRDTPHPQPPPGLAGVLHRLLFSGASSGEVVAECATCARAGIPWRTRLEAGHDQADLTRLAYWHSGLPEPRLAEVLDEVREWAERRMQGRRGVRVTQLRAELAAITG